MNEAELRRIKDEGPREKAMRTQSSSHFTRHQAPRDLIPQPCFKSRPLSEWPSLFTEKMRNCTPLFDFTQETYQEAKRVKRQELEELLFYVCNTTIDEPTFAQLLRLCTSHIFRGFPRENIYSDEYEVGNAHDDAWPHLQIIYEIFIKSVSVAFPVPQRSREAKRITLNDSDFAKNLVALFESQDERERSTASRLVYTFYKSVSSLRIGIRKSIFQEMTDYLDGYRSPVGIDTMIHFLLPIVKGFNAPLDPAHLLLLHGVLLPLHVSYHILVFYENLFLVTKTMMEKQPSLVCDVLAYLRRKWPRSRTAVQKILISAMDQLCKLAFVLKANYANCLDISLRILRSSTLEHKEVGEVAGLFLWEHRGAFVFYDNDETSLTDSFEASTFDQGIAILTILESRQLRARQLLHWLCTNGMYDQVRIAQQNFREHAERSAQRHLMFCEYFPLPQRVT